MPGDKKNWGIAFGERGGSNPDSATEIVKQSRADSERKRLERQDRIDELKGEVEVDKLEKEKKGEETQKMAELEKEVSKTKEELAAERQRALEKKMEDYQGQILQLVQGDPKVKELEKTLTETRAALDQERLDQLRVEIAKLREEKGLDITKELEKIEPLMAKLGYKKEATSSEMPPDIWLRIKQMELDQQREALKAESEREDRRDQREFEKLKWQEEKEIKISQASAEVATKRETSELIATSLEKLGQVVTAAASGGIAGAGAAIAKEIIANENEEGEISCQKCGTVIPVSSSATELTCASCGNKYQVKRTAPSSEKTEEGVSG